MTTRIIMILDICSVLNQDYQLKVAEFVHTAFNHRKNRLHV